MLNPAEAASALGISVRQLQRLSAAGLPFTPVGTKAKRYDLQECRIWLKANPTCLSNRPQAGASRSLSAGTIAAYTDACRRAQVRVTPGSSKPNSLTPSANSEPSLSLVTPQ